MKTYELSITGRRLITVPDNFDISRYVNAIIEGNGDNILEDSYNDLDELLNDMEYGSLDYRECR